MEASDARIGPVSDKSTPELTADLVRGMTALVHDEVTLAKIEMNDKAKRAGIGAGMFGSAAVFVLLALGCLSAAAIAGIGVALPVWAAALIVGGAYLVIAGAVALSGRAELARATPPLPEEALQHTKEDVEWIKKQATSAKR